VKRPRITAAARLCTDHGARGALVLLYGAEEFSLVSYGVSKAECARLRAFVERLGELIEREGLDGSGPLKVQPPVVRPAPAARPRGPRL